MKNQGSNIHFVGIGGAGMSGIAKILRQKGCIVSGSDLKRSTVTERLVSLGITVKIGHSKENVPPDTRLVVVSSAIPRDNPEVCEAEARSIEVITRGEMLARMMEDFKGIAVAGAHGKTTITSMIALCLEVNGYDPTIAVGGEFNSIRGNAKLGAGEFFVAEADESDGSFLKLRPYIAVISNIGNDHLDYYETQDNLSSAFNSFLINVLSEGRAVVCTDDSYLHEFSERENIVSYGIASEAQYKAKIVKMKGFSSESEIFYGGKRLGSLVLNVPGQHNIANALAAIAVGRELGIDFSALANALALFKGVRRRFQLVGKVGNISVIDDYAHHPTEIIATLRTAKQGDFKRIIAVFQPHRFTRTKLLHDEFGRAFRDADLVIINDIYAAGEKPISGVDSRQLVEKIRECSNDNTILIPTRKETVEFLVENAAQGDLIITLGAGDVWKVGQEVRELLKCPN